MMRPRQGVKTSAAGLRQNRCCRAPLPRKRAFDDGPQQIPAAPLSPLLSWPDKRSGRLIVPGQTGPTAKVFQVGVSEPKERRKHRCDKLQEDHRDKLQVDISTPLPAMSGK